MKRRRGSIILPDRLSEEMEYLTAVFSDTYKSLGILIMGQNMSMDNESTIIRLYLLKRSDLHWHVQEEMKSFVFSNSTSAYNFLNELPHMSALDFLVILHTKGIEKEDFN